ncbi:MAG: hypothetical protein ACLR6J_02600 [Parabacteroides merdae]
MIAEIWDLICEPVRQLFAGERISFVCAERAIFDRNRNSGITGYQAAPTKMRWRRRQRDIYPVSSPGLRIGGLKRIPERLDRNIRVASFRVDSPDVQVRRPDGSGMSASLKGLALEGISWDSTLLKLGSVHMESPVVDIYSGHFLDTLQNQTKLGSR